MTLDNEDHLQTLREPVRAIAMMMLTGVTIQLCPAAVTGRVATGIETANARWRVRSTGTAAEALTNSLHSDDKHLAFKGTKTCQSNNMPSITNVGGSLTSAVALTLIAWAVRFVRARNSRKQDERDLHRQLGRYHASLSVPALQILVRQQHTISCCPVA